MLGEDAPITGAERRRGLCGLGVAIDRQQASGVPQARQDRAAVAATAEGAIDVDPALPNPEVRHHLIEQHRGVELAGAGTDHR